MSIFLAGPPELDTVLVTIDIPALDRRTGPLVLPATQGACRIHFFRGTAVVGLPGWRLAHHPTKPAAWSLRWKLPAGCPGFNTDCVSGTVPVGGAATACGSLCPKLCCLKTAACCRERTPPS